MTGNSNSAKPGRARKDRNGLDRHVTWLSFGAAALAFTTAAIRLVWVITAWLRDREFP